MRPRNLHWDYRELDIFISSEPVKEDGSQNVYWDQSTEGIDFSGIGEFTLSGRLVYIPKEDVHIFLSRKSLKNYKRYSRSIRRMKRKKEQERRRRLKDGNSQRVQG